MNFESLVLLVLLVVAFLLFLREALPIEVTAFALLAALVALGIVAPEQAVAGFSNKAVITIGSLFVLAEALMHTGVLEAVSDFLSRRLSRSKSLAIALLLVVVALASSVLNNTAIVAISIPLVIFLCGRFGLSPSRVLIPLSYVSIFGGTLTLIGTSTNLLVSSVVEGMNFPALGMFEFTKLGAVFLVVGLIYVLVVGPRVLPDEGASPSLTRKYGLGKYLAEVRVDEESRLIGRTLVEARINERYGIQVLDLLRGGERLIEGIERLTLEEGDQLLVEGGVEDLVRLRREQGLALLPDIEPGDKQIDVDGLKMVEGVIMPTASMVGKTLSKFDFRRRFGGFVLAIRRPGTTIHSRIGHIRMQAADSLLMLVPEEQLPALRSLKGMVVVSEKTVALQRERFWWAIFALLPIVIVLAALGLVEISTGAPVAAVVLLVLGVLTPQQVYRSINWSVLFLIAAFIPVGQAIVSTGTAELLSSGLVALGTSISGAATPIVVLCVLYLVASLSTEVISNSAAAIVLAPIALSLGPALGVDSRPFVMAVCFAASASFMTPMGYQTNLMVYGPGGYRFIDYVKFGVPLNLLFWVLATLLIPVFWPF